MAEFGISVALLTPFTADGALDLPCMGAHAQGLLRDGADGITLFGTTGEGASVGMEERGVAIDALVAQGLPAGRLTLGICATSVANAAAQVRQGLAAGIRVFLVLPPFYFPNPDQDGLFDWHAALMAATDPAAQFILYHIPQVTGVALSPALVDRLRIAFPARVRAIKDSSADWDTAQSFLALDGLSVLVGDERLLHRAAALGGAGAISGVANLHPARLRHVLTSKTEDAALSREVDAIVAHPVIPALKALLADRTGDAAWARLRPPLHPLAAPERAALLAAVGTAPVHG